MKPLKLKIPVFLIAIILAPLSVDAGPVPITFQTLALFTAAAIATPKEAFIFGLIYLILGTLGLPVFGGFTSGYEKLIGPTAGFLWGFPVIFTFLSWDVRQRPQDFINMAISFFKAHILLLIPGLLVLYISLAGVQMWDTIVKLLPGLLIKSALGPLLVLGINKLVDTTAEK